MQNYQDSIGELDESDESSGHRGFITRSQKDKSLSPQSRRITDDRQKQQQSDRKTGRTDGAGSNMNSAGKKKEP
jgi:hypothetical protein